MRKSIIKLILFLSPFLLALRVELFVLPIDFAIEGMKDDRWVQSFGVFVDRFYKMSMVPYLRASIRRWFSDKEEAAWHQADSKFGPILFLQRVGANKDVPKEELNRVVRMIKGYHDLFKDMNPWEPGGLFS